MSTIDDKTKPKSIKDFSELPGDVNTEYGNLGVLLKPETKQMLIEAYNQKVEEIKARHKHY